MRPGIYCTINMAGYPAKDNPNEWHIIIDDLPNEIDAASYVNDHCRHHGEHHRDYIAIVTKSGKVHHHINKRKAEVDS